MAQITERNISILKIIVEEFLQTGEVLGSKALLKKYDMWVSSATIRNDMAVLEKLDLVFQPYNSAGRLPTAKGLRAFVNYFMQISPDYLLASKNIWVWENIKKLEDFIFDLVFNLANSTKEITFFVVPEDWILKYSGVAAFLESNHKALWNSIFNIIKMLEDKTNFIKFIESLDLNREVNVFIWEENIIAYLKDYTIIIRPLIIDGKKAYIWIIWGLKMNYSFNISAIKGII